MSKSQSFLVGLLVLILLLSGVAKLAGLQLEVEAFERWGYPYWFMILVGGFEVLAGLALLVPCARALAAVAITAFMLGALVTHLLHAEWAMMALAMLIQGTAASVAWSSSATRAASSSPSCTTC